MLLTPITRRRLLAGGLNIASGVKPRNKLTDYLTTVDDIKQANGREIGEVVYMLANNQGKRRAARDGPMRKVASWQLLFLSTGETSLAETIAKDSPNQRQTAGQQVRFIDLPCDTVLTACSTPCMSSKTPGRR